MELDNDLDRLTAVLRRLLQQVKVHIYIYMYIILYMYIHVHVRIAQICTRLYMYICTCTYNVHRKTLSWWGRQASNPWTVAILS